MRSFLFMAGSPKHQYVNPIAYDLIFVKQIYGVTIEAVVLAIGMAVGKDSVKEIR